jgi:hypothetical protein
MRNSANTVGVDMFSRTTRRSDLLHEFVSPASRNGERIGKWTSNEQYIQGEDESLVIESDEGASGNAEKRRYAAIGSIVTEIGPNPQIRMILLAQLAGLKSVQSSEADVILFMFHIAKLRRNTKSRTTQVQENYGLIEDLDRLLVAARCLSWEKIDMLDKMIAAKMAKFYMSGYYRKSRPFRSRLWYRILLEEGGKPFLKTLEGATMSDLEETSHG